MRTGAPSKREADTEPESSTRTEPAARPTTSTPIDTREASVLASGSFVTAAHDVLFSPDEPRCDVCDSVLTKSVQGDTDDDDGPSHGLYLWVRHGAVVFEEPPLCASCSAAITISALQRWEIEEEEG